MDYRSEVRNIKLNIISNNFDIKVNSPKVGGFISFRGDKIIKDLLKCGAILTGSRALKCYSVNGRPILDRKADDWDFIVNEKTLFVICDRFNLSQFIENDGSNSYVKIKTQLIRITDSYDGETRIRPTNITLICNDESTFLETKVGKVATLSFILEEKYKLTLGSNRINSSKHELDLKQIITRFNSL